MMAEPMSLLISPVHLANTVLKYGFEHNITITPMKLQRLIYLIYAAFLQKSGILLFTEQFHCWQYGAVLTSVYYKFACFRAKTITKYAPDADNTVRCLNIKTNSDLYHVFNHIMLEYGNLSPTSLCNITRAGNSAWDKAFQNQQENLNIQDIRTDTCIYAKPI